MTPIGPRAQFVAALAVDALATGGVLLLGGRDWASVVTPRPGQFLDDTLQVSGRTIDSAPTAMALVALAGAVAVIATRGVVRRIVGAVIALAGLGIGWRALTALPSLSTARAREFVRDRHPSAASSQAVPTVTQHAAWAVLTVVCAVLVLLAGALIAWRGATWTAMSSRYESPAVQADPDALAMRRARAEAALWTALDRGDDPTERDPRDTL